jgi:hypothetical protein|tara:strand:- start:162 stop:428 length:267 start_codon:yes stop_codon:yes gene_type:complete
MKHPTEIEGYSLKDLAEKIGDLRYDRMQILFEELAEKIGKDRDSDKEKGRIRLSGSLTFLKTYLREASKEAEDAWRISKPHVEKNNEL